MPDIDLTSEEEIRFTASDHARLRDLLYGYDLMPDDVRAFANGVASERGITLDELIRLLLNAAFSKARWLIAARTFAIPCNIEPACNNSLGHDGNCDLEDPF